MSESLQSNSVFLSKHVDKSNEKFHKLLIEPLIREIQLSEHSLWLKFTKALNVWFKLPKENSEKIDVLTQLIIANGHVLNDVSENASTRNGEKTSNSIFGQFETLNSTYYGCFLVLEKIRDFNNIKALEALIQFFLDWSKGQGIDIYWRDNVYYPTEDEYLKIAVLRTGSVIQITLKLMQFFSNNKKDFTKLVTILAKFFHIYDDCINLLSLKERFINNNGCNIIKEGKNTFPVVYVIRNHPEDDQLKNILRQKPTNPEIIKYCLELIKKFGGFTYSLEILKKLKREAEDELKKFEKNELLLKLLEDAVLKIKTLESKK